MYTVVWSAPAVGCGLHNDSLYFTHTGFPLCMTEQIHVAATTITKPCMHAYIRYHDVSTRALFLINFSAPVFGCDCKHDR